MNMFPRASLLAAAASLVWTAPAGRDSRQEVRDYLGRVGFSAQEVSGLETGQVVATARDGQGGGEVSVVAAVKIRAPRARVASYYGQMIAYVDGKVTIAFGRFGSPPAIEDVKDLAFDRREVDQLMHG